MSGFGVVCGRGVAVWLGCLLAVTGCAGCGEESGEMPPFVAVTFNSGTTEGMGHDDPSGDGYTSAHAAVSDQYYGDGPAWAPAVEATREFFAQVDPDMVVFQEIFYVGECADIPAEARVDFFCENWSPADPTVALLVLGDGWQVGCNLEKPDKCAAVNRRFGTFRGCSEDLCLDGLDGFKVEGCGKGSRVGRGVIDLAGGGILNLINFHGTSGMSAEDQQCRVRQVEQVFVDLGDGEPGAGGTHNLVMGDLNTDPGRWADFDRSAARWNDFTGDGQAFHFVTEKGPEAPPSYMGLVNIDHVVSDVLEGSCWVAGLNEGHPPVIEETYFDHTPVVCGLQVGP